MSSGLGPVHQGRHPEKATIAMKMNTVLGPLLKPSPPWARRHAALIRGGASFLVCCFFVLSCHRPIQEGTPWFWDEKQVSSQTSEDGGVDQNATPLGTTTVIGSLGASHSDDQSQVLRMGHADPLVTDLCKKFTMFDSGRDLHGVRTALFAILPLIPIAVVFMMVSMFVRCLKPQPALAWWPLAIVTISLMIALFPSLWVSIALCLAVTLLYALYAFRTSRANRSHGPSRTTRLPWPIPLIAAVLTISFCFHTVRLYQAANGKYPLPREEDFGPAQFSIAMLLRLKSPAPTLSANAAMEAPAIARNDEHGGNDVPQARNSDDAVTNRARSSLDTGDVARRIMELLDHQPRPPEMIEFLIPESWINYLVDAGPIAQNIYLAEWVLVFLFITLLWWVSRPSLRLGGFAVAFVFLQYIVVGCIFGVLYYDYYVNDLSKQNLLVLAEPRIIRNENRRRAQQELQVTAGHAPDVQPAVAVLDSIARYKSTLAIVRANYWTSSVFAEDRPSYGLNPIHSLRFDRDHTFDLTFPKDGTPIVRCSEGKPCHASGPDNQRAFALLDGYLDTLASTSYPRGRLEYQVELIAGADRRAVNGDNRELNSNKDYAQRRANVLLSALHHEVSRHLKQAGASNSPLQYLNSALMSPPPARLVFQSDEPTAGGCPAGTACTDDGDWRMARLRIFKGTPDENTASNVSLELATNSSLAAMLYFSFATFTTTGYGDIKPVSDVVRFWAIIENIWEILFTALFFTTAVSTSRGARRLKQLRDVLGDKP